MSESNTNAVENTPVSRTITIYATRGNSEPVDIISSAVTWGDFIPEVERAGYSVNKVLCTEGHTRMDLVNKLAILPVVDFTIFIRNKETKSGAEELSYKEVKAAIKQFMIEDEVQAKAHFGNYTTKTTADLRSLHASYVPVTAQVEMEEVEEVATVNAADLVEAVAESKVIYTTNDIRVDKISNLLEEILAYTPNEEIQERVAEIQNEIIGLKGAVTEDSEEVFTQEKETVVVDPAEEGRLQAVENARIAEVKAKQEAEKAKQARKDALAKQAKELGL